MGLLAVAGAVAVGVWFTKGRPADPAIAREADSPEASEAVLAEPTTAESAQEVMADAPMSTEVPAGAWEPAEESASSEIPSPELAAGPDPSEEATTDAADRNSEAARRVSPGPSDSDALNAKNESWRDRWRSAKAWVDRLEAEVAKLEADTKNNFVAGSQTVRIGGQLVVMNPDRSSPHKSYAEQIQARLPAARRELADARVELAGVEEGARKDGVGSSQLY